MAKRKNKKMIIDYPHLFDRGGNTAGSDTLAVLGTTIGAGLADPSLAQLADDGTKDWSMIDEANAQVLDYNNWDDFDKMLAEHKTLNQNHTYKDFMMTDGQLATGIAGAGANGFWSGFTSGGGIGTLTGLAAGAAKGAIGAGLGASGAGLLAASQRVKANNLAEQLNKEAKAANEFFDRKVQNAALNLNYRDRDNALLNLAAFGGGLDNFSNGIRKIDEGGTHEQNPLGGVPQGIASDGIPNLVEEGEVVYDDYVFSNRLKVPEKVKKEMNLKGDKMTFADAAKALQKESEERPNDYISNNGLKVYMSKLKQAQETLKAKQEQQQLLRQFAKGGLLGHKYATKGQLDIRSKIPTIDTSDRPSPLLTGTDLKAPAITRPALTQYPTKASTFGNNLLKYAPLIGNIAGAISSIIDKPDYSNIDNFERRVNNVRDVSPTLITQKMKYNPIDINNQLNIANNTALGNRRAIVESAGANPLAALNAISANNYQNQIAGATIENENRKANDVLLRSVLDFNKDTDVSNAGSLLTAQGTNQQKDLSRLSQYANIMAQRNAERDAVNTNRSTAFSNVFNTLGDVYKDKNNMKIAAMNALGKGVQYSPEIMEMLTAMLNGTYKCGGKLNTKKKGGKHA